MYLENVSSALCLAAPVLFVSSLSCFVLNKDKKKMCVKFLPTPLFIGLRCQRSFPAGFSPAAGKFQTMNQK